MPVSDFRNDRREHVRRKMRQYRHVASAIVRKLRNTSSKKYGRDVGEAIGALTSCRRSGDVWHVDTQAGPVYHVRWFGCKHRLCPVCSYVLALKRRSIIGSLVDEYADSRMMWALVTLTVKNPLMDEVGALRKIDRKLKDDCKALRRSWDMEGYVVGVEDTFNLEDGSFHHHAHMLVLFRSGLPAYNLYRRIVYDGALYRCEYHSSQLGYKFRVDGIVHWTKNPVWESDETYLPYVLDHPESIQCQWYRQSGFLIAHIEEARNKKEVVKYVCKFDDLLTLSPDQVAMYLTETKGIHRWILGGAFRRLAAEWKKGADEDEHDVDAAEKLWSVHEGLLSEDESERRITVQAIESCLWSVYTVRQLYALILKHQDEYPPWVYHMMRRADARGS